MRSFNTLLTRLFSVITLAFLTINAASAAPNVNTNNLREAVALEAVRSHQAAFQDVADANGGTRVAGTFGYDDSADYVAAQLVAAGYTVAIQPFDYPYFQELSPAEFEQLAPTATVYPYNDGAGFTTMVYSGSGGVSAPVEGVDLILPAPANTNTSTSGCEAADFSGFTGGNIALIQRGTCSFLTKAVNAQTAGAAAVIIFNEGQPGRTNAIFGTLTSPSVTIPVISTSYDIGVSLAGPSVTVRIMVNAISEIRSTSNVLAELPGIHDRVVIAGAHLDSVTEGPGINDNGSGSAALLEIALKMKALNIEPRNTVRFAWWGAEESGLVGSNYYVSNLTNDEVKNLGVYLELEMLGSPNFVRFVFDGDGSDFPSSAPKGSDNIEQVLNDYFAAQGLPVEPARLDSFHSYQPFLQAGIPSGGLFTGAEVVKTAEQAAIFGGTAGDQYDPCYHLACDTFANVSEEVLDQMSDAAAHAILTFAMTSNTVASQGPKRLTCEALGFDFSLKVEAEDGETFPSGTYPIDGLGFVEIVTDDGIYFDWISTRSLDAVIVKGGPKVNVYEYDPEALSDIDLHALINSKNDKPYGLSNVEFCFDYDIEISVRKFHDVNNNGIWDAGEPEIGVDQFVNADGTIGGTNGWPYTFTRPTEDGLFGDLFLTPRIHEHSFAGFYTVEEQQFLLWDQTALYIDGAAQPLSPLADFFYAGDADEEHEVIFGNIGFAAILGKKFHDLNADGVRDAAEPGLPGVTIELTGDIDGDGDVDVVSTVTDAGGEFGFTGLAPGDFTVTETDWPAGSWIPSTPISSGPHNLNAGDSLDLGWVFGNFLTSSIQGHKFNDLDGNGSDDTEPRLAGWVIELWDVSDAPAFLAATVTDGSGIYAFTGIAPGDTWAVCELLVGGYEQTFPSGVTVPPEGVQLFDCSSLGASYGPFGYQFTPSSDDDFLDNHFGNVQSEFADLQISKTDDVDPIVAGNTLTYTVTVNNAGPQTAQNVVVTDTLPAGVTFVSTSGCANDPTGVPTCNLGDIASGGSAQFTIQVTVDAGTTGTIDNAASATSDTTDPSPGNNSTTESTTVNEPTADLSITKTDDVDPIVAGNTLTYTVTVDNAGPQTAQNVVVTDTLPAGVTFVSTSGCANDPTGVPTCNLGDIASGGSAQFTIQVTVDAGTTGTIDNAASASSDTTDPSPGNNSTTESTTVNPDAGNQPPIAVPDAYDATGNVGIDIGAGLGLLFNDFDNDLPAQTLTATAETVASGNGGSATIAADGSFSYTPPPGYKGSDTFSYTLNDDAGGSAAATVTMTLSDMIWFVDSSAAPGGDGSLAAPFDSLPASAGITGDCIFIADGAYTGPLTLANNQVLVGEGATPDIPTVCGITLAPGSATLPATGGTRPQLTSASDGIMLASGNTVRGLNIGDIGGSGFRGTAVGALAISEVAIGDGTPSGGGIEVATSGTLAITFDSLSASSSTDEGIRLNGVIGTFAVTATNGTISTTSAPAIYIDGNASVNINTLTFASVSASGGSNGITLRDTTGSFTVTGTGSPGSGGTIQSGFTGIELDNADNVELNRMVLQNFFDYAILGTDVDNITLRDSSVTGANGDTGGEGSIFLTDVTGNALFEGNTIEGGWTDNLNILNTAGTSVITVQDSAANDAVIGKDANEVSINGNDGILVQTQGSANATINIVGVEFDGNRGDLVQTNALGTSTQDITIQDSLFHNTHATIVSGGGGITLSGGSALSNITVTYDVINNQFSGANGSAITANFGSAAGAVNGDIGNNTIGTGAPNSGSISGAGIAVGAEKNGVGAGIIEHTAQISNNTIRQVNGSTGGIDIVSNRGVNAGSRAEVKVTMTDNDVADLGINVLTSVYLLAGGSGSSGDFAYLCADIRDNTSFDASGGTFAENAVYIDQLSSDANHNLPGYAGSADGEFTAFPGTASADISTFLNAAGNSMTNGPFATFPGDVFAGDVVGVTGSGADCL